MKEIVKNLISDYFIGSWNLNPEEELDIIYVDAKQFLTPQRLDLVCKLIYIDCYIKNKNLDYATELYTEHIRAFSEGTFIEPGNPKKNSIEKYINSFNEMIRKCSKGISHKQSVVPVGADGNILDGAHRTAIAIYFNIPIPIVKINNAKVNYDYKHFKRYGLKQEYLDFISYNYILWKDNIYIACVWPIATKQDGGKYADKIIGDKLSAFYKKEVFLTYEGLINLMIHAYGHQKWAGNEFDGFENVPQKTKACYKKDFPTVLYVLSDVDLETITEIKRTIRDYYKFDNHSIHITDTQEEAILLAKELLNNNSIDFMNFGQPFKYRSFVEKFVSFKKLLLTQDCPLDEYLIDSSAVLSLYGLRDCNDIDYLTLIDHDLIEKSDLFENHLKYGIDKYYVDSIESLIYNPTKHLYFMGVKFASLDITLGMKKKRNEDKDRKDVLLINSISRKKRKKILSKENLHTIKKRIRSISQKSILLGIGYNTLGKIKRLLKRNQINENHKKSL